MLLLTLVITTENVLLELYNPGQKVLKKVYYDWLFRTELGQTLFTIIFKRKEESANGTHTVRLFIRNPVVHSQFMHLPKMNQSNLHFSIKSSSTLYFLMILLHFGHMWPKKRHMALPHKQWRSHIRHYIGFITDPRFWVLF